MEKEIKYNIENFNDLIDVVNNDNIDVLCKDLENWLRLSNEFINQIRKQMPNETKQLKNSQIAGSSFIWIDDNKNELKGVVINGEEFDFKNKKHQNSLHLRK